MIKQALKEADYLLATSVPTPAALVDRCVLQANIKHMAAAAETAGVQLRPHIKTHKTPEIARMQLRAGACGITCAKVSEAEVMAAHGIDNILIAYPTVGAEQLRRAARLAKSIRLVMACDSSYGADQLQSAAEAAGVRFDVYLIINSGADRDGVKGDAALDLAARVDTKARLRLVGIMTHEGHVYQQSSRESVSRLYHQAADSMVALADRLRTAGHGVEVVSMGSTPSCWLGEAHRGITEWRPGTYVFNDLQEASLVTELADCALTVLATVVSHPAQERYILDSGSKSLTATQHAIHQFGLVKGHPEAKIVSLSEEHGTVLYTERLGLGDVVEVIPVHACPTVNLFSHMYVVEAGEVVGQWSVAARGCVL